MRMSPSRRTPAFIARRFALTALAVSRRTSEDGLPRRRRKVSTTCLLYQQYVIINDIQSSTSASVFKAENILCHNCFNLYVNYLQTSFLDISVFYLFVLVSQSQGKRRGTATRLIIRTTARCVSRAERSSCATLVLELTTSSALSPSWTRPPRASGAARTA